MFKSVIHFSMTWEPKALEKFERMIAAIPIFHRQIAQTVVVKKAEMNAHDRGRARVEETDIVRAFFSEVPMAFYSLMIRVMDNVGFEYQSYEHRL